MSRLGEELGLVDLDSRAEVENERIHRMSRRRYCLTGEHAIPVSE